MRPAGVIGCAELLAPYRSSASATRWSAMYSHFVPARDIVNMVINYPGNAVNPGVLVTVLPGVRATFMIQHTIEK